MISKATFVKDLQLIVSNNRESAIVVDQKVQSGGLNQGPTPFELLGMALSGCIGVTYIAIARNSKVEISDLEVTIETFSREGEKIFSSIKAIVSVQGNAPIARLQRILEKTMEVCPVGAVYEKAGVEITATLDVTEKSSG